MRHIYKSRARLGAMLATASVLALLSAPALALPVLFGGANIAVEGGGSTADLTEGSVVTVTGPLLQMQLADGSTITVPKGASFRVTGEGDNVSIEVISGSIRVDSKGTPITITRNGSSITTTSGSFSAFASASGGLDGRVNEGSATVNAGGEVQEFAKGQGYLASGDGVAGTFTPPVPGSPQYASNNTQYSAADQRGSDGNAQVADDAVDNAGGGGYGGTPPVTGVIVPITGDEHTGYSIVYAADSVGIDQRTDVTVTVGDGGELNRYKVGDGSNEDLERNSNDSLERGNANGEVFIERWAGGETHGNYYNDNNGDTFSGLGRTSYQGFHVAYGEVGTNIPVTGSALYTLAAATNPTFDKGQTAPGTFEGTLGIAFGPTFKVGVDFTATMPGDRAYNILTLGGSANPSAIAYIDNIANGVFTISNIGITQGGIGCPTSGCFAIVNGVIGGDEASSIGVAWQILDFGGQTDEFHRGNRLSGAAAFTQASYSAGGGGGGGGEVDPIASGTLDAPFRVPSTGTYFGNSLFSPILVFQREATITHDLVLDEDGALIGFRATSNGTGTYALNDGVIADLAGTAYMQIGRWNGGSIQKNGETYFTVGGWQGVPYLLGSSIANSALPTSGTATYALKAATSPIFASGAFAPGVFDGSAAILFGASGGNQWKLGLDATVTMEEAAGTIVYDISTLGGIVDPSQSPIGGAIAFYTIDSPVGSSICVNVTCQVDIRSALVGGPGGRDAGINYVIYNNSSDGIMGSALFQVIGNDILYDQDIEMLVRAVGPSNGVVTGSLGTYSGQNQTITHEDDGGLSQFGIPGNYQNYSKGTTTVTGDAGNGLTWSRWTNGTAESDYLTNNEIVLGANQAIHSVAGSPATKIPTTGTALYTLEGATAPTIADGSVVPGTFSGTLGVAFGASTATARVGVDFDVAIGGFTYNILTTGGSATPGTSEIVLNGYSFTNSHVPVAVAGGPACTGVTCEATVSGFLSGVGATGAGLSYAISSNGSPNLENTVHGAAAFTLSPAP